MIVIKYHVEIIFLRFVSSFFPSLKFHENIENDTFPSTNLSSAVEVMKIIELVRLSSSIGQKMDFIKKGDFVIREHSVEEIEILKFLVKNRSHYDKYFTLVEPYITSRDFKTLYGAVDAYYKTAPDHTYIAEDDFKFFVKIHCILEKIIFAFYC